MSNNNNNNNNNHQYHHHPFEYYSYHNRHRRDQDYDHDEEQASGAAAAIRPSLRMSESWLPSWVSSDEDSSSMDTGSDRTMITPQLIYEQRRILMDIEEKNKQQQEQQEQEEKLDFYAHGDDGFWKNQSGSATSLETTKKHHPYHRHSAPHHQEPEHYMTATATYPPPNFGYTAATAHYDDRFLPISRSGSTSSDGGSISTSMEDKSILNHSVHMSIEVEEGEQEEPSAHASRGVEYGVPSSSSSSSYADELLLSNFQPNMDPFIDEEEEDSYHHRTPYWTPPSAAGRPNEEEEEDLDNSITRSIHSAKPIPIPSELLASPPKRHHHRHQHHQEQVQRQPPREATSTVQQQQQHEPLDAVVQQQRPLEATLVDEEQDQDQHDVQALRTQMEQDQERSEVFRKSLQEETERLRNRINELQEEAPKDGSCCCRGGRRWKSWLTWSLLVVAGVLVANFMLYGRDWMPFLKKNNETVTSEADTDANDSSSSGSSSNNATMSPSLSPVTDPTTTMAPTCQRPVMSTFFGDGGSYRTKSGRLDGRYDVRCKRDVTGMLIVLQMASSCQVVECVGYLLPSEYNQQCHNNNRGTLSNTTTTTTTNVVEPMGGGGGGGGGHHSSTPPDVDFILPGDYRNEILYLGYASNDFDLGCSQKLWMV